MSKLSAPKIESRIHQRNHDSLNAVLQIIRSVPSHTRRYNHHRAIVKRLRGLGVRCGKFRNTSLLSIELGNKRRNELCVTYVYALINLDNISYKIYSGGHYFENGTESTYELKNQVAGG